VPCAYAGCLDEASTSCDVCRQPYCVRHVTYRASGRECEACEQKRRRRAQRRLTLLRVTALVCVVAAFALGTVFGLRWYDEPTGILVGVLAAFSTVLLLALADVL
jgi:hypothetical protein